jgi:carbamoyltransferase
MQKPLSGIFGRWGPRRPRLALWGGRAARSVATRFLARHALHSLDSEFGRSRLAALEQTIRAGREAYVLGFSTGTHNSGAALVQVSECGSVELVCNEEEERYTAVKHCHAYPEHSIEAVKQQMRALGLGPEDLAACVSNWDYGVLVNMSFVHPALEEAPASIELLIPKKSGRDQNTITFGNAASVAQAPTRLGHQLGLDSRMPIIGVRHHDSHAYLSYGVSPFAASSDPVMVIVIDGGGDDACTSLYSASSGRLTRLSARVTSQLESLGRMYELLSSTQGGWPPLSS